MSEPIPFYECPSHQMSGFDASCAACVAKNARHSDISAAPSQATGEPLVSALDGVDSPFVSAVRMQWTGGDPIGRLMDPSEPCTSCGRAFPSPAPTTSASEQHCNGIMPGGGTSLACGLSGCICRCEICSPPATPPRATTEAGKEPGR